MFHCFTSINTLKCLGLNTLNDITALVFLQIIVGIKKEKDKILSK